MEIILKFALNLLFLWIYGMGSIAIYSKLTDFCEYDSSIPFWFAYFAYTLSIPMYLAYFEASGEVIIQSLLLIWLFIPILLFLIRGNAK